MHPWYPCTCRVLDSAVSTKAVLDLKADCAIEPVFEGRHQRHVQTPVPTFQRGGWDDGRKPAAIKRFGIAIEGPRHNAQLDRTQAPRLVINADVTGVGVVAVDEASSGDAPVFMECVFKANTWVGIAQTFVGVKVCV